MYKTIYVPVDNSDYSNLALDVGVSLAKTFGAKLVGSHVYAAKMHDKRFKQMEAGLPEEYHDENELERQRQIHDSLITRGLQIITDSYLDIVDKKAAEANIPVERRSLEGRNFKVLVEDINTNAYDLVIMGALGVGAVKDSVIGGVTERVVRRVRASDIFVIKNTLPMNGGSILVALDGSHFSFGGLKTALALGKALNKTVEAVSAFDPYFHYAAFHSISGVLNEEAGKVFRFKEQEKLHEEIIDSGLAKIYQAHLDIGREIAQAEGQDIKTTLLDGKAFEKVLQYVRREKPWMLVLGRIGVHSDDDMDIGSNAENLLRMVDCHVMISNKKYVPPIDQQAEYTSASTEEARGQPGHAGLPGPDEPELLALQQVRLHGEGRPARHVPDLQGRRRHVHADRQEHVRGGRQDRGHARDRARLRRRADDLDQGRQGGHPRGPGRLPAPPVQGQDREDRPQDGHDHHHAGVRQALHRRGRQRGVHADLRQQGHRRVPAAREGRSTARHAPGFPFHLDPRPGGPPRTGAGRLHARLHAGLDREARREEPRG